MQTSTTLLIDGNNTLHRTHWVANNTGRQLINSKGVNVGSLFTFLKTVKSYAEQFNTSDIFIAWDRKLTKEVNFRKELTDGNYKGTRDQDRNKDVYESMEPVIQATNALGIKNIYPGRLEADDVIGWLTANLAGKKVVVSVDKDFIQLIKEGVCYYNPIKKTLINIENFREHYDMTPKEFLYYKAIIGDISDNIPGIEGFGKVKGIKLAKAFSDNIETIITPYKEQVENNLKLIDLNYGVNSFPEEGKLYEKQVSELNQSVPDFNKFREICEEYEFASIIDKFSSWQRVFNQKNTTDILTEYFKVFA
jgi:DNA polymerase-1